MKIPKNLGTILLAAWLVLYGLLAFISVSHGGEILAVLAIVTGVFLFLQR